MTAEDERDGASRARTPAPRRRLPGPLVWIVRAGIALAGVLLLAVATLYFLDWNTMRGPVARYASHRLGREVRIEGNLQVKLFSWQPRVDAGDIRIANPEWLGAQPAADIRHLTFEFRLLPLLFGGRWILPLLDIEHPYIDVVREADGRTNWQFKSGGWNIPVIRRFILNDGTLRVDDRLRHLTFAGTLSSHETTGAPAGRGFEVVGNGTLNGKIFAAVVRGGPLIHVDESHPYRFTADVRAGATHATIEGEIPRPFHLARYSAIASVAGRDLADLYDLTELTLPGTPPYRISGTLTRDGPLYRFANFSGTVGRSDLHGSLSVDVSGPIPVLRGTVASRVLDFADLGPVLGRSATAPGGQSLLPDTPLRVDRLRLTDAEVDYMADAIRSRDFPLRKLATHVGLENGILLLKPLTFDFSHGRLAGFVRIDAQRPLTVTNVDARLTGVRIEQFIRSSDKPVTGPLEARAVLSGAGDSVRSAAKNANGALTVVIPGGRIRRSLAEWLGVNVISALGLTLSGNTSDTGLRCAIAHFGARNGVFTAQRLVFDTDPVLVTGSGDIDLRNDTIDISAAGKPKHFQLMRLNVPITVRGPLAHPAIGVRAGAAVAQAGIAAALGFLSPLVAILPFVDADLAKNANCAALVSQAGAKAAPVRIRKLRK